MNYAEAAEYAGVDPSLIVKAVQNRELKAYRYEMARIGNNGKGEKNYIVDIGAGDIDKWLEKRADKHHRPQRLVTFVHKDEYDKFVDYCAKKKQKCSWVIRELICKELISHGYKLQRYSKED